MPKIKVANGDGSPHPSKMVNKSNLKQKKHQQYVALLRITISICIEAGIDSRWVKSGMKNTRTVKRKKIGQKRESKALRVYCLL